MPLNLQAAKVEMAVKEEIAQAVHPAVLEELVVLVVLQVSIV